MAEKPLVQELTASLEYRRACITSAVGTFAKLDELEDVALLVCMLSLRTAFGLAMFVKKTTGAWFVSMRKFHHVGWDYPGSELWVEKMVTKDSEVL